jgi:hypothetical protein
MIRIKVFDENNKKIELNLENYSDDLIRSGYNMDINQLFIINETIIEGLYLNDLSDYTIYVENYLNCKLHGKCEVYELDGGCNFMTPKYDKKKKKYIIWNGSINNVTYYDNGYLNSSTDFFGRKIGHQNESSRGTRRRAPPGRRIHRGRNEKN